VLSGGADPRPRPTPRRPSEPVQPRDFDTVPRGFDTAPTDLDLRRPAEDEPRHGGNTRRALDGLRQALLEPEQVLADQPLRVDEETLREVVDDPEPLQHIQAGLTTKLLSVRDDATRARMLGLRAVVTRLLGDLKEALDDAEQALRHAQRTGSARRIVVASIRLARILQWRGDYLVADELYQRALDTSIPDRLRASVHYYFGTSCYDQGRYLEAMQHFETVLGVQPHEGTEEFVAASRGFAAITQRAALKGFGPFPRARSEILQETPPPQLRFHEVFRRYGYAGPDGIAVIPPTFRAAYPFAGGYAWVRPDTSERWSLIDTSGEPVIAGSDYQSVGPFHEGLAWVMSDPLVGWYAIDSHGIVVVPPAGYTDARTFHAGLAAVKRNGAWGAVDRDGREVVPMEYDAFRTATSEAAYLAGFTSEGLAVVERNGVLGVINRAGDVLVPLVFRQLEIHPVGFLVMPPPKHPDYSNPFRSTTDLADGWGAMDRAGELVVETVHPNRAEVLEEMDKLMRDAHPIL
jgi:tetratricopeptide (TPR) repeat protein